MEVRKAVIPAAGWGTRFLPVTRAYPKELLPLINKPLIQYAVEEAVNSGIEEIVIVIAEGRHAIPDYFKAAPELRAFLQERGGTKLADEMARLDNLADITYVMQSERRGLGHAVLMAKKVVGNEPFAVILPDDVVDAREPVLAQMLKVSKKYESSVVAVESIDTPEIQRYGVIRPETVSPRVHKVLALVEKPTPETAPSSLGIVGRYILTPEIFDAIETTRPGSQGEIQLTDAASLLLKTQSIYALEFEGRRFDAGNPVGWVEAQMAFGLKNPEFGDALREKLRRMI
ncbi:MAG: UTP--glucose-1-phosphate uridylyltransferase [Dehalococcoidia bacterium]|nr:MAG: UTP--glucose-1-phosphate uridylyltransferase [Dehalococcoidia bacterium]